MFFNFLKLKLKHFFLGTCSECSVHNQTNLQSMYLEYINSTLIPELQMLTSKYSVWWSFKPNSILLEYLQNHNIFLDTFFCPEDLFNAILKIAENNNMFEPGNNKIIVLDKTLQLCFKAWTVYVPDILKYCSDHVLPVSKEQANYLQNESVHNEFFVNAPENIIYNDPACLFWLHPDLNSILNNSAQIIYTWKEINILFLDFCSSNNQHFSRKDDSIFVLNPTSELSHLFKFKHFHQDQIHDILTNVTKFLGKSKTLEFSCPHLKFDFQNINKKTFKFIDLVMNNYNRFLPAVMSYVQI
jgi:hypothetical protein